MLRHFLSARTRLAGRVSLTAYGGSKLAARSASHSAAVGYTPGQVISGFVVERVRPVKEFDLVGVEMKHQKTGAKYLHVIKDDSNNVFNVGFPTPVTDSTGVPHILEHTTLCGSKKYPVRDPFFKMLNRSMATFMNALTGNDYTMYPFSTENKVDFQNLMDVYMDSTFSPMLREMDFKQEGWRLEHSQTSDPQTPLIFKGVVYNEMKGVLSDISNIFAIRAQQALYPNSTYSHVSGGDPPAITDLTHQQLLDFHRTHYHPSNAIFYTYGNFPLEEHAHAINEKLQSFDRIPALGPTEVTACLPPNATVNASCPVDPMSDPAKQTKMATMFLTNQSINIEESFALRVLTSLLMDGAAAPMYKALIEPNIGTDYCVIAGYNQDTKLTNVAFGLQGIHKDDVERVQSIIMDVLKSAAESGFDQARVDSLIHQTELAIKHRRANFGMSVGQQIIGHWLHGGDPLEFLEVAKQVEHFRTAARAPDYFPSLIRKYFLQNEQRMLFVMSPDAEYNQKVEKEERQRLSAKTAGLSEDDKKRIFEEGLHLAKTQEEQEDLSCLPSLAVDDIAKHSKTFPVTQTVNHEIPLFWRSTATNGVSYSTIAKSLSELDPALIPYLPLFCSALSSLGTQTKDLAVLDEVIRSYTGGLSADVAARASPKSLADVSLQFELSSDCLDKNIGKMYELMGEVMGTAKWDDLDRLRTVILSSFSDMNQGVVQSGHRYAMMAAAAGVTPSMRMSEQLAGLEQVGFLSNLAQSSDAHVTDVSGKLQEIARFLLTSPAPTQSLVISQKESHQSHESGLPIAAGLLKSTGQAISSKKMDFSREFHRTFYTLPLAVNFTAKTYSGVPYMHQDSASLQVLASILSHRYLHREIREKGGAYGGGASYSPLEGTFSFWSYRDPSGALARTLEAYDAGAVWAMNMSKDVGISELNEAKLSLFQQLDSPLSASAEGRAEFQTSITSEMRQKRREAIFAVGIDDVMQAAAKYISPGENQCAVAVLGAEQELRQLEQSSKEEWKVKSFSA
ncbi:peptidase M16C associated-domain-containing protein [Phlyctochytrium arcticum]|nr:peptidase M16C associated-domain-containing protein [Phlyctochytrium arcticum]